MIQSPWHLLSVNVNGFIDRMRYPDINRLVPQCELTSALMFAAWKIESYCPVMDYDLLGKTSNPVENLLAITKEICIQLVEPDGLTFNLASVKGARIAEVATC